MVLNSNDFVDVSDTTPVKVLEPKLKKQKEQVYLLYVVPETGKVLATKSDDQNLLNFEYDPKSGSFFSTINQHLRSIGLLKEEETLHTKSLNCIFDKVISDTVHRVFMINKHFSEIPNQLDFVAIKKLTNVNNPNYKVYLELFLKIFSSLELTQYFKI